MSCTVALAAKLAAMWAPAPRRATVAPVPYGAAMSCAGATEWVCSDGKWHPLSGARLVAMKAQIARDIDKLADELLTRDWYRDLIGITYSGITAVRDFWSGDPPRSFAQAVLDLPSGTPIARRVSIEYQARLASSPLFHEVTECALFSARLRYGNVDDKAVLMAMDLLVRRYLTKVANAALMADCEAQAWVHIPPGRRVRSPRRPCKLAGRLRGARLRPQKQPAAQAIAATSSVTEFINYLDAQFTAGHSQRVAYVPPLELFAHAWELAARETVDEE